MEQKIGIIGTGNIGVAIATVFLNKNYHLSVFNRTKDKIVPLLKYNVTECADALKLLDSCNVILLCISDFKGITNVLPFDELKLKKKHEKLIINISTISPEESILLCEKLFEIGISYLEAPVSGGPIKAINGQLGTIVSGNEELFNKYKYIFDIYCCDVFYTGKTGNALTLKIINNLMETINLIGAAEALVILEQVGMTVQTAHPIFKKMRGYSLYLDVLFERHIKNDIQVYATSDLRLKDLKLAEDLIDKYQVDAKSGKLAVKYFEDIVEKIGPKVDQTACYELVKINK